MKPYTLMQDILREMPEAPMRDFIKLVNDEVERLINHYAWTHFRARHEFEMPEVFTNQTLTNGSPTLAITGAYFRSEVLVGTQVTITDGGTDYTFGITSVESETSLTLDANWTEATTSTATVTFAKRSDWRLPADFRRMHQMRYEGSYDMLHDPADYTVDLRASDNRRVLLFHREPTGSTDIICEYFRNPTQVDSPEDTIDLPALCDRVFYLQVIGRLMNRMPPELVQLRLPENQGLYREALDQAKRQDVRERKPTRVNQNRLFRLNRYGRR